VDISEIDKGEGLTVEILQQILDLTETKQITSGDLDKLIDHFDDYIQRPHVMGFWLAVMPDR
jgi:hypothetical protein